MVKGQKTPAKKASSRSWWSNILKQVQETIDQVTENSKPPSPTRKPRKKALLIGINKYRIPGADLRGCVNDVRSVEGVLKEFFGFKASNIRTVLDYRATTVRMKEEIVKLVTGAVPGDVLFLHYSGHGSNVPDTSGDEADHRDEIFCPTDLDWSAPLLDDFLRATFAKVPKGVNLTVLSDSCHSGSATRAFLPPDTKESIPRYLPCPLDIWAAESGRDLQGAPRGKLPMLVTAARDGGNVEKDVTAVNMPDVLFSGCLDTQTSADAFINGTYNGAMSYHLVKAIRSKGGKLTNRELHAETLRLVKKGGYSQTPQLSGKAANLDHPFLEPYV